jgi:rhamnulokinase
VFSYLKEMADFPIEVLHIIGGGSLNNDLNQFTANSCGVEVLAGPQECTALGNIMIQAKAAGEVRDLWEMRKVIANSIELKHFHPKDKAQWDAAYEQFLAILDKKG